VGGGPAGLECALSVARRGYSVSLAEAANAFGGRLRFETRLPGLATWGRVLDWRLGQLERLTNVNLYMVMSFPWTTCSGSSMRAW